LLKDGKGSGIELFERLIKAEGDGFASGSGGTRGDGWSDAINRICCGGIGNDLLEVGKWIADDVGDGAESGVVGEGDGLSSTDAVVGVSDLECERRGAVRVGGLL